MKPIRDDIDSLANIDRETGRRVDGKVHGKIYYNMLVAVHSNPAVGLLKVHNFIFNELIESMRYD